LVRPDFHFNRFVEAKRFMAEASKDIDIARIKSGLADLRIKMGSVNREKMIQHFSWESVTRLHLSIYEGDTVHSRCRNLFSS
jgi:hypothetical protein